jgi:hypothetical protein
MAPVFLVANAGSLTDHSSGSGGTGSHARMLQQDTGPQPQTIQTLTVPVIAEPAIRP